MRTPVTEAFEGSNAVRTRTFLRTLESSPRYGQLAAELFRAQKASRRAKQYRGDFRGHAYRRKEDQLQKLCSLLASADLRWGWGEDLDGDLTDVLYIDLPNGQVSFHSPKRLPGPDYPGEWDGQQASESRILAFCARAFVTTLEGRAWSRSSFAARLQRQRDSSRPVVRHSTLDPWHAYFKRVVGCCVPELVDVPAAEELGKLYDHPDHARLGTAAELYRQQEAVYREQQADKQPRRNAALAGLGFFPATCKIGRPCWRRKGQELRLSQSGNWIISGKPVTAPTILQALGISRPPGTASANQSDALA